jgi:hypothetical protein
MLKKILTICLLLANAIIILNVCVTFAIIYFIISSISKSDFMLVLHQITYDNKAEIFLSYFHGYNKNEIFADNWDT